MVRKKEQFFGWSFPVKANSTTGRIEGSSYRDAIRESIKLIIMTKKGERVMRPNFGCDINKYMFDILDVTTIRQIEFEVEDALKKWEPRIDNIEAKVVESRQNAGQLIINVSYTLLNMKDVITQTYIYDTTN